MEVVSRSQLRGRVQTVLGLISPEDLGITLPHEHPNEVQVLRAGAHAQQITGAPISIHAPRHESDPLQVIRVLTEAGAIHIAS